MPTIYTASKGPHDGAATSRKDKLLERVRKRFDYMTHAWKEIRDEAELDMRAQSIEGPWKPEERNARVKQKRPCIHLDQLNQYTNNLVNEVRQNPLAIKVDPAGDGATEETAELRGNRIRQIEYESNATQAYLCAFENAAMRSYGVFGVVVDFKSWDSRDQAIRIRRFPNPDAVLWDPDCKEADFSDMQDAFVLDRVRKDEFERKYPDASVTDFGPDVVRLAPQWFDDDSVQVGEYWYIDAKARRMFFVETLEGEHRIFADELEDFKVKDGQLILSDGTVFTITEERKTRQPTVKQCLTNGVEILDETEWVGRWIPLFPVIGKEKYIREGNRVKRVIESYIRQARDAAMLFDYYKTNEAEVVGMTPKTPFIGYEGQFDGHDEEWRDIGHVPRAFLTARAVTEETGAAILPLPQRQPYDPAIQALEIGAESARRAIQAALGSYGFTRLDDTNVKSGKAINLLDRQSDMGSFHFIDNFKTSLRHAGRVIDDLLDKIETGPREVGVRKMDGTHEVVKINQPYRAENGEEKINRYRTAEEARHDVTISTGPSYQSQREEASEFADLLAQSKDPSIFKLLGPLIVRLKNLGPIGDEMADLLELLQPPEAKALKEGQPQIPPEIQEQLQQYEAALTDAMKQLEEFKSKNAEIQATVEIERMRIASEEKIALANNETKTAIADLQAESKESIALLQAKMEQVCKTLDIAVAARSSTQKEAANGPE